MKNINRRRFIQTSMAGVASFSLMGSGIANVRPMASDAMVDQVQLGNSGLTVSRVAMGTGTIGYNNSSNQTRLGMDNFVRMARHGYDRGIRFFDTAEGYGSLPYVGQAIKGLPRENITLLTKIWTHEDGSENNKPIRESLDRYRKMAGSDYIDIILLHCMTSGDWDKTRRHYIDGLSKAKQDGIIKAVGVSCHNWDAMVTAAESPWVDVIMARINPFGSHMDGTPEAVSELLVKARQNGKGVVGMKIFGEGKHITDQERETSIEFALSKDCVNAMTLGLESIPQVDDAVERVMRLARR